MEEEIYPAGSGRKLTEERQQQEDRSQVRRVVAMVDFTMSSVFSVYFTNNNDDSSTIIILIITEKLWEMVSC